MCEAGVRDKILLPDGRDFMSKKAGPRRRSRRDNFR